MSGSAVRTRTRADEVPTLARSGRDQTFDRIRCGLIACWIVVLATMPFVSEKMSSWNDLRAAVASGDVQHVSIANEMPHGVHGSARVTVHWSTGSLDRVTTVRQVAGEDADDGIRYADEHVTATLHRAPSAQLRELQPGLEVTRARGGFEPDDDTLFGFAVPGALAIVGLILALGALVVLVGGPQPWRATKWAWFWWFTNPLGMAAFLAFSGPVPGLPAPRRVERRLTGGWSFLLSVFVSSVSVSFWNLTV